MKLRYIGSVPLKHVTVLARACNVIIMLLLNMLKIIKEQFENEYSSYLVTITGITYTENKFAHNTSGEHSFS